MQPEFSWQEMMALRSSPMAVQGPVSGFPSPSLFDDVEPQFMSQSENRSGQPRPSFLEPDSRFTEMQHLPLIEAVTESVQSLPPIRLTPGMLPRIGTLDGKIVQDFRHDVSNDFAD